MSRKSKARVPYHDCYKAAVSDALDDLGADWVKDKEYLNSEPVRLFMYRYDKLFRPAKECALLIMKKQVYV